MRYFSPLLAVVLFAAATASQATVHKVYPGDSIQAAIDHASPGDTILVAPGEYREHASSRYGLRITTDNLRLIGKVKKGKGEDGKVRLIANGAQETGVLAAPAGCDYDMNREECEDAIGGEIVDVKDFYIRGFSVEDFPVNGIQTRWVDGFKFVRNESANNLNNGIYPTLSANGLVRNNESYGSLDTAMWVAGSENVRVIGNTLSDSVIGFEITVSNNVRVTHNEIFGNTVGVGLFHPNGAGNPPLPVMENWVIKHNDIYDNNLPNPASLSTFQGGLPSGYGVLLLGVSDHVIAKNDIENNDGAGIGVLGWCTATSLGDPARSCEEDPPRADPSSNNNLIAKNKLKGNGANPPPIGLPGVDILYIQTPPFEPGTGNCFKKNKPKKGVTFFSSDGELPTDGC